MTRYRSKLPQLAGGFFLSDGGIDTDLIFNHGIEIREFATHTLLADEATSGAAAYFMVNCAHPDHFFHLLGDTDWSRRIRGIRCNASRLGHAELDQRETLDDGDPAELAASYAELRKRMPWLVVFGGCCGTDLRHVTEIARIRFA